MSFGVEGVSPKLGICVGKHVFKPLTFNLHAFSKAFLQIIGRGF